MNTLLSISAKICQFDTKLYLKEKYKHPVISSLLIIIVFFISGSLVLAEAQQNKIDSLTRIANASTSDSLKIDTFHQLFKLSYQNDLNASLKYIKEGLSIAKRAKSEKGSSLLIHDLGVFYWCTDKYDSALICFNKRLEYSIKLKDSLAMAGAWDNIGAIFIQQGSLEKGIEYRQKANRIYLSHNEKTLLASGYNWIGQVYEHQGQYSLALDYFLKAQKIFENTNNSTDLAMVLTNASNVFRFFKQYEKAENLLLKAKNIFEKENDKEGIGVTCFRLYLVYAEKNDSLRSLNNLKEAKQLFDEINSLSHEAEVLQGFISFYNQYKQYDKAINYAQDFLRLSEQLGMKQFIANANAYLANENYFKKNYTGALIYLDKAFKMSYELNDKQSLAELAKNYILVYAYNKDPLKVDNWLEKYEQIKDTIYSQQTTKAIAEMQTKYETEKKDKEIVTLKLESQKRKYSIWAITSGFGFLFMLSGSGFVVFRNKKKREQAELYQKVTEYDIKAVRAQINPHFIFNCIHSINQALDDQRIEESKESLSKFSSLTRSVLENSEKGTISLSEEIRVLSLYMDLENTRFNTPFTYSFHIDPQVGQDVTLLPPLILQPFIENSIKHGFEKNSGGNLKIEIISKDDKLICTIEDNGKGRNTEKTSVNISGYKKESFGLRLSKERLKLLRETRKSEAFFEIEDLFSEKRNPAGTRVKIVMPFEQAT